MTATVRWNRSSDGYVTSKCGYWKITPLYWGCVSPQSYQLWRDGKKVGGYCETQRDAKEEANRLVKC